MTELLAGLIAAHPLMALTAFVALVTTALKGGM